MSREYAVEKLDSQPDNVGLTARMAAAVRAIETQRADGLFKDPYAALLAGEEILLAVAQPAQEYEKRGTPIVAVRTRFFDDFLKSVAPETRQVVLLGAGMDTRSFRLDWQPDTHVYELEQASILQIKEPLLAQIPARCHRHLIATDLRHPWSELLLAQGFQQTLPAVWLLEGFLYYLNEAEVHQLLQTITQLSQLGSWLGMDLVNLKMMQSSEKLAQYWQFGCDDPETWLSAYGWQASVLQPGEEGAHFGRFTYRFPPRQEQDVARIFFVTARKEKPD